MIDPNAITTARVGELPPSPFELTDNIPHEIGETLFRGTVQQLGDTIGDYLGVVSGSAYNNTIVPDGGTLPDTTVKEWLFVGKGTFHNVGGQPDIITTEELNILSSNGTYWSLAVEIPIDVELAGITQNIRSGYTETVPSENAIFNRFAEVIGIIENLKGSDINNDSSVSGETVTEALDDLQTQINNPEISTRYGEDFTADVTKNFTVPDNVVILNVFIGTVSAKASDWTQAGSVVNVTSVEDGDLVTLTGLTKTSIVTEILQAVSPDGTLYQIIVSNDSVVGATTI